LAICVTKVEGNLLCHFTRTGAEKTKRQNTVCGVQGYKLLFLDVRLHLVCRKVTEKEEFYSTLTVTKYPRSQPATTVFEWFCTSLPPLSNSLHSIDDDSSRHNCSIPMFPSLFALFFFRPSCDVSLYLIFHKFRDKNSQERDTCDPQTPLRLKLRPMRILFSFSDKSSQRFFLEFCNCDVLKVWNKDWMTIE
jgi:hypothetical protein